MLSVGRRLRGRGPAVVAIALLAILIAACGAGAEAALAPAPAASGGSALDRSRNAAEVPVSGTGDQQSGGGEVTSGAPDSQDLLIIKTGSLSLQVTGLDPAVDAATRQITALGGYASGSDREGDGEDATASITFRIPAARWDEALAGLRHLADKVLAERSGTEDVTRQVVDLGARIKNLEATEKALQAIMERAGEIKDVLAVQAELTKVRGDIEQMTAEKQHLEEQAAMSTLTVSFALKPNPVLTSQQQFDAGSEAERASASLVSVLQGLATAGIWFAIVWLPILAFLGILGGIGFVVARRLRRGGPGVEPPIEPTAEAGA
jgi:uncharacterized protein DUF4349